MTTLPILDAHKKKWESCTKCSLGTFAKFHVFHRGTVPCELLFIGEGPNVAEDVIGEPVQGDYGQLLDRLISDSVPKTCTWAVTNLVACRATDGVGCATRQVKKAETDACRPRLVEYLTEIAKPRAVVLLGRTAFDFFPPDVWCGPILSLAHPAYLYKYGGIFSLMYPKHVQSLKQFYKDINDG